MIEFAAEALRLRLRVFSDQNGRGEGAVRERRGLLLEALYGKIIFT
jgi:hypothetical protein